jgi:hypothetical protein
LSITCVSFSAALLQIKPGIAVLETEVMKVFSARYDFVASNGHLGRRWLVIALSAHPNLNFSE